MSGSVMVGKKKLILWEGGDCPVHGLSFVEVYKRSGRSYQSVACNLSWMHRGEDTDILSYCVIRDHDAIDVELQPKVDEPTSDNYVSLMKIFDRAFEQASVGKGADRHAQGLPFEEQPMQSISRLVGTHRGLLYQAIKKAQESTRMERDAAVRELLGAINYIAGAIIYLENE